MWRTLFQLPHEFAGLPIFGWGWALLLWSIFGVVIIVYAARHSNTQRAISEWLPFVGLVALFLIFVLPKAEVPQVASERGDWGPGIAVRGYGLMMGISILCAIALALWRGKQRGVQPELLMKLGTWLVVCGILGGRIFYLTQYWDQFASDNLVTTLGAALNLTQGGLVVYGAFIGGFLAFVAFTIKYKLPFLALADLAVPSLMVGLALGRVGCFMNGCCYGGPTEHAWGVRFPPQSVPYEHRQRDGSFHGFQISAGPNGEAIVTRVRPAGAAAGAGLSDGERILRLNGQRLDDFQLQENWGISSEADLARALLASAGLGIELQTANDLHTWALDSLPARTEKIHPTQLYSAITATLICLFLLVVEPFLQGKGKLFAMWITIYPPARFLLELIRTDESAIGGTGLTISQNVSLGIFALAVGLWIYLLVKKPENQLEIVAPISGT